MPIPKKAIREAILPNGIAIYDVSNVLPKSTRPRYNIRPNGIKIIRIFFHNSGAYGNDGFRGAMGSVRYVIRERDFGAVPYHFWLARIPDIDPDGNIVIYRLAEDQTRCWHTGGAANDEGIGVVWQGNLRTGKTGKPTDEQYKMANALTNWLEKRLELTMPDGLSFHSEADLWGGSKKASCPGPFVEEWVKERRSPTKKALMPDEPVKRVETPKAIEMPEKVITKITHKELKDPKDNHAIKKLPKAKANPKQNKQNSWFKKIKNTWLNNLFPGRNK